VLCWGYGGILSLGQGVFFGLGGYCMAMFLKLEASTPENTAIQSTPGIPDFMDWNQRHRAALVLGAVPQPPLHPLRHRRRARPRAFIIGTAMFKRRVGGVYFAIITQAIAAILTILIIGQQGYTGGVNGITDLRTLPAGTSAPTAPSSCSTSSTPACCSAASSAHWVRRSKVGRLLVAMRDQEDRVRFSGYDVANFKIFVFCLGAAFAAIGGAMFTLQVGFMSPTFVGIVPIDHDGDLVRGRRAAVDVRRGLRRAAGQLGARRSFSERFPELWLFAMGGLFIAVVMLFPMGLAGLYQTTSGRGSPGSPAAPGPRRATASASSPASPCRPRPNRSARHARPTPTSSSPSRA
jgi:urea transport system permease protein